MGYDRTVVFDEQLDHVPDLEPEELEKLYALTGHQVGTRQVDPLPLGFDQGAWLEKLGRGELHPTYLFEHNPLPAPAEQPQTAQPVRQPESDQGAQPSGPV